MFKVKIKLNRERLEEDGYDYEHSIGIIRDSFIEGGFPELETDDGSIVFRDFGPQSYGAMWGRLMALSRVEWFTDNVDDFIYYTSDGNDDENDFDYEDIKKISIEEGYGTFAKLKKNK